MDNEIHHATSKASHSDVGTMPRLTQIPTSVTLSAEQFEKLYLSPMMHRQSSLNKSLGNPTPLYVLNEQRLGNDVRARANTILPGVLVLSC